VAVLIIYTFAILLGSALLFMVQPMVAKMILPSFGGAPAVWNTCLVFFQAALLGGYAYAHYTTKWLGPKRQALVHVALLIVAVNFAVSMPENYDPAQSGLHSSLALLSLLIVVVGVPFFVCSAGAPLVQRWFAATGHRHSADPYFLYAASNFGSFLALISYPLIVEPNLALDDQSRFWRFGFFVLVGVLLLSAVILWRSSGKASGEQQDSSGERTKISTKLWWIALAAVPSSLLLGVTSFLTTNIAAAPLLWVIPLSIYLLTYVLAFKKKQLLSAKLLGRITGFLALAMALLVSLGVSDPILVTSTVHLLFFTSAALFCHTRLADARPQATNLTEFYLFLSLGGVLGGAFNALIAPEIFSNLAEYPIAIVAALMFREAAAERGSFKGVDLMFAAGIAAVALLTYFASSRMGIEPGPARNAIMLGVPIILAFLFFERPFRYALSIGAILLVSLTLNTSIVGKVIAVERSFFGVHRVVEGDSLRRTLLHGNTIHGRQSLIPEKRHIPLTYYHPTGPMGSLFEAYDVRDVGLVGLGVGALAAYGEPGDRFTFFEIDPTVVRIAQNTRLFTFLSDSKAEIRIVIGDARLTLEREPSESFDMLVLDAFSSDAIPTHLLTIEALEMYLTKLRPGGILAYHISNRYLDLSDVLARAADKLKLQARIFEDSDVTDELLIEGKTPSTWVVFARAVDDLAPIARNVSWSQLQEKRPGRIWTDDYSNVLEAFARDE
jgi:spermidine synthase